MPTHRNDEMPPRVFFLRRRCVWLLGASLVAAGCHDTSARRQSEHVEQRYAGVHIRFIVPANFNLAESWMPAVNDWADEVGASCELIEVTFDTASDDLPAPLTEPGAALILVPTPLIGRLVGENRIAVIPQATIDANVLAWQQIPPSVRATLGALGGAPAIVPVTCPTPVMGVRTDLLDAAERQLPTTWAEYDQLIADLPQWAPGHVAVEPWADESLTTVFFARAISGAKHPSQFSVELDVTSGAPLIGEGPYVRALTEMQALKPQLVEDVRSLTSADCLDVLTTGKAAMGLVWESDASVIASLASASASESDRGQLTFLPLPGRSEVYDRESGEWTPTPGGGVHRPALCGFAGLAACVLKSGTDVEQFAAWDLWGLLSAYQTDGTIPPLPGSGVVPSRPAVGHLASGLSPGEEQTYQRALTSNLQNPSLVCELPMLGRCELRSALQDAIVRVLDGGQDPTSALENAQGEWSRTIDSLGRTRVLNSYRLRLGLVPVAE